MHSKSTNTINQPDASRMSSELINSIEPERKETFLSSKFKRIDGPWSWVITFLLMSCQLFQYGCSSTYGILFPDILKDLKSSRALTAFPGSAAVANSGLLGPFIGKLCDRYGSRKILFVGSLTSAVGLLASSFSPNIGVLIGAFGFVLGAGCCMVYFSTMVAIPLYFDKYRFEATSVVSIGPGSSLLAMSPIVQALNQAIGWRTSMLAMTGFSLIPLVVSLLMRSTRPADKGIVVKAYNRASSRVCQVGDFFYFSALKNKMFLLVTIMTTISSLGHCMKLVHLAKVSEDMGIDSYRSSWLYFIIGLSSTISRLFVGKFGKAGPMSLPNVFLLGNVILATSDFVLPSMSKYYALVLYSIAYGVGEGLLFTSSINTVIESVPSEKRGSGYGLFQFSISLSFITAPVLSGFIADVSGSYDSAFYTAGSLEVFAGCLSVLSCFMRPTKNVDEICIGTLHTELVIFERETVL